MLAPYRRPVAGNRLLSSSRSQMVRSQVMEKRGYCTLCRSRCGAVYTVEGGALTGVRPDPEHPTGAAMCPKGGRRRRSFTARGG
ncbi:hypothetical protein NKH77_47920 [Streptomyces sp. M19]